MNKLLCKLVNEDIDVNLLSYTSSLNLFKTALASEEYDGDRYYIKICDFLVGFQSTDYCILNLLIRSEEGEEFTFHYILDPNKICYSIDDKFIMPYFKLYNSKVYIKNFTGNPSNLTIIKCNIPENDKNDLYNQLLYCKLNINQYIYYKEGKCVIKNYLHLDRQTRLFSELKNIKVCKFAREEELTTHLLTYPEEQDDTEIRRTQPLNFLQTLYKFLFN